MRKLAWLSGFLWFLMFCSDPSNPFSNHLNAKVLIREATFRTDVPLDTVPIFTTQEVVLASTVQELLDSFSVTCEGNRYWTDSTIRNPGSEFHSFRFSFAKPGEHKITIVAYRSNREKPTQVLRLVAVNPLSQSDLPACDYKDSVVLSTPSVGDKEGIIYNWRFGKGKEIVRSFSPVCTVLVSDANNIENIGSLWVTDGKNSSDSVSFTYFFYDSLPPVILCLNDLYDSTLNTITTPDSVFSLKLLVSDRGSRAVASITFNGEKETYELSNIYTKIFNGMHNYPKSSPLRVIVRAIDNFESMNEAIDTFYVVYDSTAQNPGRTVLEITSISGDTVSSNRNDFSIFGTAKNSAGRTMLLKAQLNSLLLRDTVITGGEGVWNWKLSLQNGFNVFKINVLDTAGVILKTQSVTIFFDPSYADNSPPVIFSLEVNNTAVTAQMSKIVNVSADSARIKITAFDEGSGISNVLVNGIKITNPYSGYLWQTTIRNLKTKANPIIISVSDAEGNSIQDTIILNFNRVPNVANSLSLPFVIRIDSVYTDNILTYDADGDSVRIIPEHLPQGMTLSSEGKITWDGSSAIIGRDTLKIKLFDNSEFSKLYSWPFLIVDPATLLPKVDFADIQFPQFLQAGKDVLKLKTAVKTGTGEAPFLFSARLLSPDTVLFTDSQVDSMEWKPLPNDTGTTYILLSVKDNLLNTDTLYRSIPVVPKNQSYCSVKKVIPPEYKVDDGSIVDMRSAVDPVVIGFQIIDSDHPLTERYTVTMEFDGKTTIFDADSMSFNLTVKPSFVKTSDTIKVKVVDNTMRPYPEKAAVLTIPVLYMWTENPETSYLRLAYTPQTIVSTSSGGNIHRWFSEEETDTLEPGVQFTGYQQQIELRPILLRGALNGYDVGRYRDNAYLRSRFGSGQLMGAGFTVFVVAMSNNNESQDVMALVGSSDNFGSGVALGLTGSGRMCIANRYGDVTNVDSCTISAQNGKWNVFSYRSAGISNGNLNVDVRMSGTQSCGLTLPNIVPSAYLIIGSNSRNGFSMLWRGDIAEVLIYNEDLPDSSWVNVERYLMQKYNLLR